MSTEIDDKCYAGRYHVNTVLDSLGVYIQIDEYVKEFPVEFKKFNDDIFEYYDRRKQSKRALHYKMHHRETLQMLVDEAFVNQPEVEAYVAIGGSTVNGCGSYDSDLDLCIVAKNPEIVTNNKNNSELREERDQDREVPLNNYLVKIIFFIEDDEHFTYWKCVKCSSYEKCKGIFSFHLKILHQIYTIFLKHKHRFQYLRFVQTARVPIIACKMAYPYNDDTLIEINCNNIAGIYNSHLLHYYAKVDMRFPMMALALKTWGAKENIINPMNGRINAYSMQCMIIHFLQCAVYPPVLPNLCQLFPDIFGGKTKIPNLEFFGNLPDLPKIELNKQSAGELIIGFFDYYSKFNYANNAISLKFSKIFSRDELEKEDLKYLFFMKEVYDPFTVPKNLREHYILEEIINKFKNAIDYYLVLRHRPNFEMICPHEGVKKMTSEIYNR